MLPSKIYEQRQKAPEYNLKQQIVDLKRECAISHKAYMDTCQDVRDAKSCNMDYQSYMTWKKGGFQESNLSATSIIVSVVIFAILLMWIF